MEPWICCPSVKRILKWNKCLVFTCASAAYYELPSTVGTMGHDGDGPVLYLCRCQIAGRIMYKGWILHVLCGTNNRLADPGLNWLFPDPIHQKTGSCQKKFQSAILFSQFSFYPRENWIRPVRETGAGSATMMQVVLCYPTNMSRFVYNILSENFWRKYFRGRFYTSQAQIFGTDICW